MTSAEFSARYHLVKPVADGAVRTLQALSTASGTSVMVHYLVGNPGQNQTVRDQIDRLPGPDKGRILEMVDVEGNMVVVTQLLAGFATLGGWLAGRGAPPREISGPANDAPPTAPRAAPTAAPTAAPSAAPTAAPPTARSPGEFTKLFGAASAAPAAGKAQPGEFTRLFQSQGGASSPSAPSSSPMPMPAFPPPPAPPVPPMPFAAGPAGSGRATDVLGARSAPPPIGPVPVVVPPVTMPAPGFNPLPPPALPLARSAEPAPFFMPVPAATPVLPTPVQPPPSPALPTLPPPVLSAPAAAPAHIASDFTRILGGVSSAPSPNATPPAAAPAASAVTVQPAPKKPSNVPLIIILNAVGLAAIALVLYLVLKK